MRVVEVTESRGWSGVQGVGTGTSSIRGTKLASRRGEKVDRFRRSKNPWVNQGGTSEGAV